MRRWSRAYALPGTLTNLLSHQHYQRAIFCVITELHPALIPPTHLCISEQTVRPPYPAIASEPLPVSRTARDDIQPWGMETTFPDASPYSFLIYMAHTWTATSL